MAGTSIAFGYYPKELDISIGDIAISTLPNLEDKVDAVNNTDTIYKKWLYAPLQEHQCFTCKQVKMLPYSSRVFGLPKTHALTHTHTNDIEYLEFLIWCLGFFTGIRLTTTEAGFLDATPVEEGLLTDFVLSQATLEKAIQLTDDFWQKHRNNKTIAKRIAGIIHALLLAQYPQSLMFEKFLLLYTALDACYACVKEINNITQDKPHTKRIDWMCNQLNIPSPSWAVPQKNTTTNKWETELSIVRNNSIHESLFFDEPLGFSIYGGNSSTNQQSRGVLPEMQALISRLLVSLLIKSDCNYVKYPVNARQRYLLEIS